MRRHVSARVARSSALAGVKACIVLGSAVQSTAASSPDVIAFANTSRAVARRLSTVVSAGSDLQAAIDGVSADGVLELGSGTFTGSYDSDISFYINKDITIRAQIAGQAVLDGGGSRRVFEIQAGRVVLEGLNIKNGRHPRVSASPALFSAPLN